MNLGFVKGLVPWIAPPVIGAFIGYITNDIAIRMLFRPLKQIRVLGIRVPFTPGIFPKERYMLSKSIGLMVSRELITDEAVRRQLHGEKTQAQLAASLSSLSAHVLNLPLSRLSGGIRKIVSSSLEVAGNALHNFLSSTTARHAVRDLMGRAAAFLAAQRVGELLDKLDVRSLLADTVLPLLSEQGTRESISAFLGEQVSGRLGDVLTDDLIDGALEMLAPLAEPAVDRLVEWLNTARMRAELSTQGKKLLSGAMEKLNLFQRFILSAGQFERRLEEKLPEIVDETISALEAVARDPENRSRLLEVLRGALRDWRKCFGTDEFKPARDRLGRETAKLASGLLARLGDPEKRGETALDIVNRLAGGSERTLGDLLDGIPGFHLEDTVEKLSTALIGYTTRRETSEKLSRLLMEYAARFLDDRADVPLGSLLGIDAARKAELDAFILSRAVGFIDAKLPEILSGLDVQELVVQKIDALEVQEVENLLLGVIASHLRWINVFGALLGFFIGLIQILLRVLGVS